MTDTREIHTAPLLRRITDLEAANATLREQVAIEQKRAEFAEGLLWKERTESSKQLTTAQQRAETAEATVAEQSDKITVLEHNQRHYVHMWLNALTCDGCKSTREARLAAAAKESLKGVSPEQLDTWITDLETPMSAADMLLPEELENKRLKVQLGEREGDGEFVDWLEARTTIRHEYGESQTFIRYSMTLCLPGRMSITTLREGFDSTRQAEGEGREEG